MRLSSLSLLPTLALTTGALATVTPGTLFGDAYLVVDGARTYSVLDVYIKCSTSKDIISSVFGTTGWTSSFVLNNSKNFVQSNGTAMNSWLPTNDDGKAWDSYVTCGARMQGSDSTLAGGKAGFLGMQLDTNWAAPSSGSQIVGQAGGAGWYPSIGASSSSNPYCRSGYLASGSTNIARTLISGNGGIDGTIAGNGITPGQSLANHWMIGRFTIEVTGDSPNANNTLALQFGVAGRNYASESSTTYTTFTGATSAAGRFNSTLTFASIPAPGVASLLGIAGALGRRRRD